jgi:hypothetical protein
MRSGHTIRSALLARLRRTTAQSDCGSIAFLLLVIVVSTALGAVLMNSIISQSKDTRFAMSRIRALDSAQAGIDYVLGQMRAAVLTSDPTTGDDGLLPCGPWNDVPAAGYGPGVFTVSVAYYTMKPTLAGASPMVCTSEGPYDVNAGTRTPRYALITSTGTDGTSPAGVSQGRSIQTTYVFQTNDVNITGGQIRIFPAGPSQYCMDAGSNPAAGTAVMLQPCSTSNPPIDQQVWAYRSDLSIELVSSAATTSTGLCISTTSPTHSANESVVLKACEVADGAVCPGGYTPTTYQQKTGGKCQISQADEQWSVDDNAHLEGSNSTQTDIDGYCIDAPSQAANVALILSTCAGSVTDTYQTWVPAPTTGAGMAGAGNLQLVNYKQFATCLDVTGQNVAATYLILYTCKQNPNQSKVAWNQKFQPVPALNVTPTTTLLTTTTGGTTYCLYSPQSQGGYPYLVPQVAKSASVPNPCPSSVAAAAGTGFQWTVYQRYSNSAGTTELPYASRYTIQDASGLCLGPGDNDDLLNGQYYKAVVAQCDGSTGQKWNADPSLDEATLINTHEIPIVNTVGS